MVRFDCIEEIPLSADCCLTYENMAFDGCYYYFILCGKCKIVKYDRNFCEICKIPTCREYGSITYDTRDKYFWAASKKISTMVFKLNSDFEEIGSIQISSLGEDSRGIITGLSYDCYDDSILVASPACVSKVSKCDGKSTILQKKYDKWISGILSLSPGYLVTAIKNSRKFIYVYAQDGDLIKTYHTPDGYSVQNIVFNPCSDKDNDKVMGMDKDNNIEKKHKKNIVFYMLSTKMGCCPFVCKTCLHFSQLGFIPSKCNYDICKACCHKKPCHADLCNDILESIALVETSIAHILNSEGEKLQKVIASTNDIDKILYVNKEVNNTIVKVTSLENVLYAKLSELGEQCGFCDKQDQHSKSHDDKLDKIESDK